MQDPRDIFKRFSDSARYVLVSSQKIAETAGTGIGTDHMLLALTVTSGNLANEILKENMVNSDQIRLIIRFNNIRSIHGHGLSSEARRILEKATQKVSKLGQNLVEPEHLLWAIVDDKDCVANKILNKIGLETENLKEQIEEIITIDSPQIDKIIDRQIESMNIPGDQSQLPEIMFWGPGQMPIAQRSKTKVGKQSKTPTLDYFGQDLTLQAKNNKLDPVIGREKEIARLIQILCRRTKNNPVLVGDPGVGKTAIVEGFAQKMIMNQVPMSIQNKRVVSLDLALIVSGTMYRGQFEERIKKILEEINRFKDIIIFLDELHTMVGTGSAEGSMDTANILKPALAKGVLRLIGATTSEEYRKHIEKDAALERRLQPIKIEEPNIKEVVEILKGIRRRYEDHHQVKITDEAIESAVNLSKRYISDRFLPDKAIDLIDEASAAVQIASELQSKNKKVIELENNLRKILQEKEKVVDEQDYEKAALLKTQEIRFRFQLDKILVESKKEQPKKIISNKDIAKVVSLWTGIPMSSLIKTEKLKFLNLDKILKDKIVGQEEAISAISQAIKRSKAGISNPNRPIGSFIFLGPTGVGKTELARVLAREVFGSEASLIKIDMSEFMEKHNISRLVGAPPGYIGYEDAGKLTESVRRKPYSLILLDEIEKAHPEIFSILLQIMEDGYLTDAKGRKVNFRNTIIIMTSNIGMQELSRQAAIGFKAEGKDEIDSANKKYENMKSKILERLKDTFKPELINRLDKIIVFKPLDKNTISKIVELQIDELIKRLNQEKIYIKVNKPVIDHIAKVGFDPDYGARPIRRTISDLIENPLSDSILAGKFNDNKIINISVKNKKVELTQ